MKTVPITWHDPKKKLPTCYKMLFLLMKDGVGGADNVTTGLFTTLDEFTPSGFSLSNRKIGEGLVPVEKVAAWAYIKVPKIEEL